MAFHYILCSSKNRMKLSQEYSGENITEIWKVQRLEDRSYTMIQSVNYLLRAIIQILLAQLWLNQNESLNLKQCSLSWCDHSCIQMGCSRLSQVIHVSAQCWNKTRWDEGGETSISPALLIRISEWSCRKWQQRSWHFRP